MTTWRASIQQRAERSDGGRANSRDPSEAMAGAASSADDAHTTPRSAHDAVRIERHRQMTLESGQIRRRGTRPAIPPPPNATAYQIL